MVRHQAYPIDEANDPRRSNFNVICYHTLDFIQVPDYPSAILVFALTHSRRNVVQRLPWLMMVSFRENILRASRPCRTD
jgi:hypothetical protein